jgi:hypothetical protein
MGQINLRNRFTILIYSIALSWLTRYGVELRELAVRGTVRLTTLRTCPHTTAEVSRKFSFLTLKSSPFNSGTAAVPQSVRSGTAQNG